MKKIRFMLAATLCITLHSSNYAQAAYTISKINLEGNGGWDYLTFDESGDRLFVSHGTQVQVVDMKNRKPAGTITDTKGVHGIALANDLNKGFISNGKDASVTVFNLRTLEVITKVTITGVNPDAILYDQFSHRVFVYNGQTANATVIDALTDKIVATIPLSGRPEFSVTNGKGMVYVNIEDRHEIAVINATTLSVEKTWKIAPGEEPSGLAIDNSTQRLFAVCGNKLMIVVDAQTGKTITTLPIGDHCDGVVFDAAKKLIYASNGEGSITVVKEENEHSFKVVETITTQKGAKTIALDNKTHQVYLTAAEYGPTPGATADNPKPRAPIMPGTFAVLVVEKK